MEVVLFLFYHATEDLKKTAREALTTLRILAETTHIPLLGNLHQSKMINAN